MLQIRREQGFCELESLAAMRSGVRSPYAPPRHLRRSDGKSVWPVCFSKFFCRAQIPHTLPHTGISGAIRCTTNHGVSSIGLHHERVSIQIQTRTRARSPPCFAALLAGCVALDRFGGRCFANGVPGQYLSVLYTPLLGCLSTRKIKNLVKKASSQLLARFEHG